MSASRSSVRAWCRVDLAGGTLELRARWASETVRLRLTRPGSEDFIWTADGRILMGEGSKLYGYRHGPRSKVDPWVELADFEPFGVRGITRLALSPDQRRLAVVGVREVEPAPPPPLRPFALERR